MYFGSCCYHMSVLLGHKLRPRCTCPLCSRESSGFTTCCSFYSQVIGEVEIFWVSSYNSRDKMFDDSLSVFHGCSKQSMGLGS